MSESLLNGRVTLHGGDNRVVLKGIPDCSVDSDYGVELAWICSCRVPGGFKE